ncbi:MAG: beta-N-acetylhexosaminidase, partial [Victivallales bacterium]|nr:beta-N-acetylhexosaminidase [Victivallales bacterium]
MLKLLQEFIPVTPSPDAQNNLLRFERLEADGLACEVTFDSQGAIIRYNSLATAARGLGNVLAGLTGLETSPFTMNGVMMDISRNKVFSLDGLRKIFCRLALLGFNTVLLYAEDTYELSDAPYFGYMRGRLTATEVRQADDIANSLGLELIGCIQTLGHLEQYLRWNLNGYHQKIQDTSSVLMVGPEETKALVANMLDFWSTNLRSRRLHIGMDETHDLGRGRYLDHYGYTPGYELFNRQLQMTCALCAERGLRPMLWDDMFFRLGNPEQAYYSLTTKIPQDVLDKIPAGGQTVYWDYYNRDQQFYEDFLQLHRDQGLEPIMGSGIWIWSKLWFDYDKALNTLRPCVNACRKLQVREIFFTMWNDDGAICHFDSAWTGLVKAADLAF